MGRKVLSDEEIPLVAERFRVLAEPTRLLLLRALMQREHTVNELVHQTRLGQANVSKHLQVLHATGFVHRRKTGLFVHYAIADRQITKLWDLVCARLGAPVHDAPVHDTPVHGSPVHDAPVRDAPFSERAFSDTSREPRPRAE